MESIYNLIPKAAKETPKKTMYRSKYDPKAPLTGSTFGLHGTTVTVGKGINELKKTCVVSSTFGPRPSANISNPSNFLRKGTRSVSHSSKSHKSNVNRLESQKPPVPSRHEKPVLGLKSDHNFITANAVNVILSSSSNKKDDKENFMKKENFGKVPEYLKNVKKEVDREIDMVDDYVKRKANDNNENGCVCETMDEKERDELVKMLQKKWDDVNRNYQKVCHRVTMETPGDIRRKENQEAQLEQLESDIKKLTKPGPIVIRLD